MVQMESLLEEAMQVVVEQELQVEQLPATLQVDTNIRSAYFLLLCVQTLEIQLSVCSRQATLHTGGVVGLASCQGGEGVERHRHVVGAPPGGHNHTQFGRGGLITTFSICAIHSNDYGLVT